MRLLLLWLGWLALASDPVPTAPVTAGVRPSGSATAPADLSRLARLCDEGVSTEVFTRTFADTAGRKESPAQVADTERAEYVVDSAARSTQVFVLPPGPRTLVSFEVRPTAATAKSWLEARLRLIWEDDDPEAHGSGVDVPLGLAFGRGSVSPVVVGTRRPRRGSIASRCRTAPVRCYGSTPTPRWRAGFGSDQHTRSPLTQVTIVGHSRPLADSGRGHVVGVVDEQEGTVSPAAQGQLTIDGRPFGRLADVSGRSGGGGKGATRGSSPIRSCSGSLSRSRPAGSSSPRRAGKRVAVFWYSERRRPD